MNLTLLQLPPHYSRWWENCWLCGFGTEVCLTKRNRDNLKSEKWILKCMGKHQFSFSSYLAASHQNFWMCHIFYSGNEQIRETLFTSLQKTVAVLVIYRSLWWSVGLRIFPWPMLSGHWLLLFWSQWQWTKGCNCTQAFYYSRDSLKARSSANSWAVKQLFQAIKCLQTERLASLTESNAIL